MGRGGGGRGGRVRLEVEAELHVVGEQLLRGRLVFVQQDNLHEQLSRKITLMFQL